MSKPSPHRAPRRAAALLAGAVALAALPAAAQQDGVLSLEQAIRTALAGNERALAADSQVEIAGARLTKARAAFLPSMTVSGQYTRRPFESVRLIGTTQIIVQNYNALSGSANFSLSLFDSDSLPALKQASANREADRLSATDSKRVLAFDVGNAYLAALGVDQVLEASKRRLEYARQSLAAAKARFAAGLVSGNDVTRAELEVATAEMGIAQAQGSVDSSYLRLGYLLNAPAPRKLVEPEILVRAIEETPAPVEALIAQAQSRRPDVSAMRWRSKSSHAAVLEPTLRWLPSFTLTGSYRYTNEPGLTGRSFNWNVGANMSWNVFDGLTRNGDYAERRLLAYQADLNLQSALRGVELDVREALVSLDSQRAGLRLATAAHAVAQKNATEIAELYRQGLGSALQVADANVRLFEAAVDLARARFGLGIAYLNFESALGLDPLGKEPALVEY